MVSFLILTALALSPAHVLSVESNIAPSASNIYGSSSANRHGIKNDGYRALVDYSIDSQWHAADFDNSNGQSWLQFDFTKPQKVSRFETTSGRYSNFNAKYIQVYGRNQQNAMELIASHSNSACYSGHRRDTIYAPQAAKEKGYTAIKFVLMSKCGGIHFAMSDIKIYGEEWVAPTPAPEPEPESDEDEEVTEEEAKKTCAETTPLGKKICKKALPEAVGTCKWKKKKCVLKQYNLPCEKKGKRKCKKAVKKRVCVYKDGEDGCFTP